MTEWVTVNGHRLDCAYMRALDDFDDFAECDCEPDDYPGVERGFYDEDDDDADT
jgi:hypothetical protein